MTMLTDAQKAEALTLQGKKMKHAAAHFGHPIDPQDWAEISAARKAIDDATAQRMGLGKYAKPSHPREQTPEEKAEALAQVAALRASNRALVESLPTFGLWGADRAAKAAARAELIGLDGNSDVDAAILDLIARHARAMGWTVKRSAARNGLKSTVYVTPPGSKKVRISDHYLPQTYTRQIKSANGIRGSWAGEIITTDIASRTIDDIFAEILSIAEEQ